MSYTPKTIWTCDHVGEYGYFFPDAVEAEGEYGGTAIAFRRTDLPLTNAQLMSDPRVKALVEALSLVDALDPEGMAHGCSQSALIGLVLRMGETARTAIAQLKEPKE